MIFLRKIRASAMQFAILVSAIVAVLLGSFLTLTQTHRFFNLQSKHLLKSIEASNSGMFYAMQRGNTIIDSTLLENEIEITTIKKNYWGGFQLFESKGDVKSKSFKKIALTGSSIPKKNISLFISDISIPLVLVGNTKIEGTVYISEKGVKPGVISGHYFNGNKLIDGEIKYSPGVLPELDLGWIAHNKNLIRYIPSGNDQVIPLSREIKNSFFEKTKVVYNRGKLEISESITGNVLVKSDSEITITKYADLTDVTLVAPYIKIRSGFSGNAHLIASDSIVVEEKASLFYPSSVVVLEKRNSNINQRANKQSPIVISENSFVSGTVTYLSDGNPKNRSEINVDIHPSATIEGQVYCQGNVQLSGTVIGSVFTDKFVTKGFGSVYVNHIFDGQILGNDIHSKFSGLPLKETNNTIAKWLY